MKFLTTSSYKTIKGEARGYLTGILYLAPNNLSGQNVCPMATPGCIATCLNTSWRGAYNNVQAARIRKTREYFANPEGFKADLIEDIQSLCRKATREKMIPCVRINGTSDLPGMARQLADEFPNVQFYDYTKIPKPWNRVSKNYHLTFSLSELNLPHALDSLKHGINVAAVFETDKFPDSYLGHPVVNGDINDLRFLDPRPVVVALKAKGRAKRDNTGFVIRGM